MTVSTHNWAVGEVVTAANLNTYLRDNLADLQSNKAVLYIGTYTGDGTTSQPITGVGFTPKWMTINADVADAVATVQYETTTNLVDNDAQGLCVYHAGGALTMQDNRILSLDSDGFTVTDDSADANPNKNGASYEFVCVGQE